MEHHAPERVMRQFGFHQPIPPPIDTDDRLHRIDRRGRAGHPWSFLHRDLIQRWHEAEENVVTGVVDPTPLPYYSPYMVWFRLITRRLIVNPVHRVEHGMRPNAPAVEYYVSFSLNTSVTSDTYFYCSCKYDTKLVSHRQMH